MPLPSLACSRYVLLVVDDRAQSLTARLGAAATGAEVITCPSPEAAGIALASGRRYSALVARQVEPDLADLVARSGTPVLTVSPGALPTAVASAVAAVAVPVRRADQVINPASSFQPETSPDDHRARGRLVAVCGPGGTGTSSVAAALAVALGVGPFALGAGPVALGAGAMGVDPERMRRVSRRRWRVLLADLARRADHAFLGGVEDEQETGLLDLLDAGRYRPITAVDAHRHTVARTGYRLLPGLRRPTHWTAVSPVALDSVLAGLVGIFDRVVADITGDFEGEDDAGSLDVEERNHLARRTARVADLIAVVGGPGPNGMRRLALLVDDLLDLGVDPDRIQPVINGIPEPDLGGAPAPHLCGLPAAPVELPWRRGAVGRPIGPEAVAPLTTAIDGVLARLPTPAHRPGLVPLAPGSLGCRTP